MTVNELPFKEPDAAMLKMIEDLNAMIDNAVFATMATGSSYIKVSWNCERMMAEAITQKMLQSVRDRIFP